MISYILWLRDISVLCLVFDFIFSDAAAYYRCPANHINMSKTQHYATLYIGVARLLSDTLVLIIISNVIFLCECFFFLLFYYYNIELRNCYLCKYA